MEQDENLDISLEHRKFKKVHKCKFCLYYNKVQQCLQQKECFLDEEEKMKLGICPRDRNSNCPYGNEVGTCFNFCWQEILREHKKHKEQNEKGKEKVSHE